jgi:hypothetical protein
MAAETDESTRLWLEAPLVTDLACCHLGCGRMTTDLDVQVGTRWVRAAYPGAIYCPAHSEDAATDSRGIR